MNAIAPVRRLTVLYDAECSLCTFLRDWLVRQPQWVPLELVPAGSAEARRRFPGLLRSRSENSGDRMPVAGNSDLSGSAG